MASTYPQIIELAKKSGLPYKVVSTFRLNAKTRSGKRSHHADGQAVDFGGYNQDALAAYFMGLNTLEVFHKSNASGTWYGSSNGQLVDESTHQDLVDEHRNHLHVAMSPSQVSDVKPSGLTGVINGLASGIPNLLQGVTSPAATVVDVIRPIGIVASNIANPFFWVRMGMGAVGIGLIIAGVVFWNRRPIGEAVSKVGGVAGSLVGTAAQGAAFGVGAGVTGGLGGGNKPSSSAPTSPAKPKRPGPKPPAILPPPNAPTTAVLPPEIYAPTSPGGTYTVTTVRGTAKRPTAPLPNPIGTYKKRSRKGQGRPSVTTQMKDT